MDESGLESSVCEKHIPYALLQSVFGDLQDQRKYIIGASEPNLAVRNGVSELDIATMTNTK